MNNIRCDSPSKLYDEVSALAVNVGNLQRAVLGMTTNSNISMLMKDVGTLNSFLSDVLREIYEKYSTKSSDVIHKISAKSLIGKVDATESLSYDVNSRTEGLSSKIGKMSDADFEVSNRGTSGKHISSLESRNMSKRTKIIGGSGYCYVAKTLPDSIVEYLNLSIDKGIFDVIKNNDGNKKCFYFVNKNDVEAISKMEEHRKAKQRAKGLPLKNEYMIYFWGSEEAYKKKILEWESLFASDVKVELELVG